jgi:hypothetical protein
LNSEGLQVIESERFDDETAKCSKDTVGGDAGKDDGGVEPCNWIQEGFDDVRPFDVVICNAGIVFANTFEGDVSLSVVEDLGSSWVVRKEQKDKTTPGNCARTSKQINILPSTISKVCTESTQRENR